MMGWMTPFFSMEAASSCKDSSENCRRGCWSLGTISSILISTTFPPSPLPSVRLKFEGSSASKPLPKPLLAMADHFPRQLHVHLRPFGTRIIGNYRLPVTGGLAQPHIPGDNGLHELILEVLLDFLHHLDG